MIDLAVGAAVVAGLFIPDFITRHRRALRKSVFKIQSDEVESGDQILSSPWVKRALPWERHKRSLCLLMHAHVKGLRADAAAGVDLCERLLSDPTLPTSLRGLAYLRLAVFHPAPKQAELLARGEDLWAEGLEEVSRLSLWEDLGYLLWGCRDSIRAAYCWDRELERRWSSQSLYMRYVCYSETGISQDEKLKMAQTALQHNKIPIQQAALLHVISSIHLIAGRVEEAAHTFERYKTLGIHVHPHFAARYSVFIKRARGEYDAAEQARDELLEALGESGFIAALGVLHDDGEYERAIALLEPHLGSDNPDVHYAAGTLYLELGDPVKALTFLEKRSSQEFSPSAAYNRVQCYAQLCRRDKIEEHLLELPACESDLERTYRRYLSYFWDGDPEAGARYQVLEEFCLETALYEGNFEALLVQGKEHWEKLCITLPQDLKLARVNFFLATTYHWMERIDQALLHYIEAEKRFTGSPFDRMRCRVQQIDCRARLGEEVDKEFAAVQKRAQLEFPNSVQLGRELQSVQIHLLLSKARYQEAIQAAATYLQQENRQLPRALELLNRAGAYTALGQTSAAHQDRLAVQAACPGSFLARRAQT